MADRVVYLSRIEIAVLLLPGDEVAYRLRVMQEMDEILEMVERFRQPTPEPVRLGGQGQPTIANPQDIDHTCPQCKYTEQIKEN